MQPVDPRPDPKRLPASCRPMLIGSGRWPSIVDTDNNIVLTRWTMTADERRKIAEGADIYLMMLFDPTASEYTVPGVAMSPNPILWETRK